MGNALGGGDGACCGPRRDFGKGLSLPVQQISVLQDERIHFVNDAAMVAVMHGNPWEERMLDRDGSAVIKDVNGISLFKVARGMTNEIKLYLPTGTCHAQIIREGHDCWHVYVGRQRRVTTALKVVADNPVFLVHALGEPYPERGTSASMNAPLPLPTLSVRGDFAARNWFVFDCSDLSVERKVAKASNGMLEGSALFTSDAEVYCVEVSGGLDVALVTCIGLIVDDWLSLTGMLDRSYPCT